MPEGLMNIAVSSSTSDPNAPSTERSVQDSKQSVVSSNIDSIEPIEQNDAIQNEVPEANNVNREQKNRTVKSLSESEIHPQENTDGKWYWSDGVEGQGEKPEFFNDKTFKTVLEQAKAQPELRKLLGAFTGAPEQYDMSLKNESIKDYEIDPENPVINTLQQFCRSKNMNQESFSELLEGIAILTKQSEEEETNKLKSFHDEQIKKMGENGSQRITELEQWVGQQDFSKDHLPIISNWMQTVEDINALEAIRSKMGYAKISTQLPTENSRNAVEIEADLRKRMADPRYTMDTNYTKYVDDQYREYWGKKLK